MIAALLVVLALLSAAGLFVLAAIWRELHLIRTDRDILLRLLRRPKPRKRVL